MDEGAPNGKSADSLFSEAYVVLIHRMHVHQKYYGV